MMSTEADRYEPLVTDLRGLFAKDDPVPPLVVETAKASLGWRRLDADLAELLSDSVLEEAGEPALARGGTAQIRSVTFTAGGLTIDIEIQGDGDELRILGQLSPATAASVELQSPAGDGPAISVQTDELGRFRAPLPPGRAMRLRIGIQDPSAPGGVSYTETSWVPL